MKKLVSIIMSIVMLFSIVSAVNITALANDYTYTYGDWEYGYYEDDTVGIASYNGASTSVSVPTSIRGTKVTGIESQSFENCQGLSEVYIPNTIEWISPTAFKSNKNLKKINVDNGNAYYTSVDGVLFSKDKTQIVIYPRGNTSTTYSVSDNVTTIGNWAFYGCSNLVDIQISDSVTSIGDAAFASCFSLTNIKLPNKLVKISTVQFLYCSALTSITIPKSVNKIMGMAFDGCDALKDVYYPGTEDDWKKIEIGGMNDPLTNATIHYNYVVPQEPQQPATPNEPAQPSTPSAPAQTEQPSTPTQPSQSSAAVQKAPKGAALVGGEYVAKKQKNATIKKVKAGKKSATVSWKKVSGVTGYQIQYSTSKKFTKKTTKKITVKKNKTVKTTVKKLKSKKKYYVRIRTYKNVKFGGKTVKVYSPWSKTKAVKIK